MRRLFLSIMEGETPQDAVPLLATEDQALIRLVAQELAIRLGLGPDDLAPPLRLQLVSDAGDDEGDGAPDV